MQSASKADLFESITNVVVCTRFYSNTLYIYIYIYIYNINKYLKRLSLSEKVVNNISWLQICCIINNLLASDLLLGLVVLLFILPSYLCVFNIH